jgi:hypothetical protein
MANKADTMPVGRSKSSSALSVAASEMSGYTGEGLSLCCAASGGELFMQCCATCFACQQ